MGKQSVRVGPHGSGNAKKTKSWLKHLMYLAAYSWHPRPRHPGPLKVTVWAVRKRTIEMKHKREPDGFLHRLEKPDGDNVLKMINDGIVRGGVVVDDDVLVVMTVHSQWAPRGQPGFVHIQITEPDPPLVPPPAPIS